MYNNQCIANLSLLSIKFRRTFHMFLSCVPLSVLKIYRELCDEERAIQDHSLKLECSLKGVIREHFLKSFMSRIHWESLNSPPVSDAKIHVLYTGLD